MGKRTNKKPNVTEAQLAAAAMAVAGASPEAIAAAAPVATVGSNSGAVSPAFVHGRNIGKSYFEASNDLRTDNAAVQATAVQELKIGLIFNYIAERVPAWQDKTDMEAYLEGKRVLDLEGKKRTEMERKAEVSARTEVSRLFTKYEIENLNPRGGSNKLSPEQQKAKAEATRIANAKKLLGLTDVVAPQQQVQLAAFVIPSIDKVTDYTDHLTIVERGLKDTLTKATNVISGADLEKIVRPRMATIIKELEAIKAALTPKAEG